MIPRSPRPTNANVRRCSRRWHRRRRSGRRSTATSAASMLDVLWSVVSYERLVVDWRLDPRTRPVDHVGHPAGRGRHPPRAGARRLRRRAVTRGAIPHPERLGRRDRGVDDGGDRRRVPDVKVGEVSLLLRGDGTNLGPGSGSPTRPVPGRKPSSSRVRRRQPRGARPQRQPLQRGRPVRLEGAAPRRPPARVPGDHRPARVDYVVVMEDLIRGAPTRGTRPAHSHPTRWPTGCAAWPGCTA